MGCKNAKVDPGLQPVIRRNENSRERFTDVQQNDDHGPSNMNVSMEIPNRIQQNRNSGDVNMGRAVENGNDVEIRLADSKAFDASFVEERQRAIDNGEYRKTIESWKPKSLDELAETLKSLSRGKSAIDCHWGIFYWIACNIDYDTVSYFSKNFADQTAKGVFRTRKGVCAGYANLYKYLSDQLEMPCEVVIGYAKGYSFDNRQEAPSETDHAWNAVEIDNHWYLLDSTWGAGYLNEEKAFERKLKTYYFLARPNEMIYHHLPEKEKWQLLETPINMQQYMRMPKVYPIYFELKLELVSPRNQAHVDFVPGESYALVVVRAPSDVDLSTSFKLNDEKIDGGDRVVFDNEKQVYCCYFAPSSIGKHKITIFAKQHGETYHGAINLTFDVKQLPRNLISFPETWKEFFILGLEVVSPLNTHLIKLNNDVDHTEIQIKAPEHVQLISHLGYNDGKQIEGGDCVYYDRKKDIWRCQFAPDRVGHFKAFIFAKKKSDPGSYKAAVAFKIEAKQIPSPPLSYPKTWQPFYDLDLKIVAPKNRGSAVWAENASYTEVLIQAPEDVILSCDIEYNAVKIKNGSLAQFDHEKNLWQLLFAPEQTGLHVLVVYGKRKHDTESSARTVVQFNLDVIKLRRPMKFPLVYTQFHSEKCRIYTPMDGILKKDSVVSFDCFIPDAKDVNLTVDGQWLESEGYTDPNLRRQITVGSKEVAIYAKYGDKTSYNGLVKYSVE